MTNNEGRRTKEIRSTNVEKFSAVRPSISSFGFRHWSFGFAKRGSWEARSQHDEACPTSPGLTRGQPFRGRLKCPRAEQEVHDIPLVRLQPVQLNRRDRADIETVD